MMNVTFDIETILDSSNDNEDLSSNDNCFMTGNIDCVQSNLLPQTRAKITQYPSMLPRSSRGYVLPFHMDRNRTTGKFRGHPRL